MNDILGTMSDEYVRNYMINVGDEILIEVYNGPDKAKASSIKTFLESMLGLTLRIPSRDSKLSWFIKDVYGEVIPPPVMRWEDNIDFSAESIFNYRICIELRLNRGCDK